MLGFRNWAGLCELNKERWAAGWPGHSCGGNGALRGPALSSSPPTTAIHSRCVMRMAGTEGLSDLQVTQPMPWGEAGAGGGGEGRCLTPVPALWTRRPGQGTCQAEGTFNFRCRVGDRPAGGMHGGVLGLSPAQCSCPSRWPPGSTPSPRRRNHTASLPSSHLADVPAGTLEAAAAP